MVWDGWDGNDYEIVLYDGTTTTQLTNNSYDDSYPQVSGSNVVWHGSDGNDYEIFMASLVPEPSTIAMLISLALCGIGYGWWRGRGH